MAINKDYSRDSLFDELGLKRLRESYMRSDEDSPQDRFEYISNFFSNDENHAQRMYDYMSKHWISNSTPILSFGKSKKALPISCYLVYLEDTSESLLNTYTEVSQLSMAGGGVGIDVNIRSLGGKSSGVIAHAKTYDASMVAFKQGETRRGSYALFLDINHPDIVNFIEMRKPTGDPNLRCMNLNYGVNISDEFMQIIENCMKDSDYDDSFELKDPDGTIKEVVSAKRLWSLILETRMLTGFPFLHFIDTSNRKMKSFQKEKGLRINQTNLCTEIIQPTNEERTAICCLLSYNLVYYDEYKDNKQIFKDTMMYLDNVLQYFIENAPDNISKAKYSAMMERSIGLGTLGFHDYLQKNNIPLESALATSRNKMIFKNIKKYVDECNLEIGSERGEAPDAKGTGRRFSLTMSIAPNASSSIILGNTSPSIEPFNANVYRQDTLSGFFINKNKNLDKIIKEEAKSHKNGWYDETWSSILSNDGSVQHLEWMDKWTKDVFKTAFEIEQKWILQHAIDRQEYIDQAQSLNLFILPNASRKYVHDLHFKAWKGGLKTLYYCRSKKTGRFDKLSAQIERQIIEEDNSECLACQ